VCDQMCDHSITLCDGMVAKLSLIIIITKFLNIIIIVGSLLLLPRGSKQDNKYYYKLLGATLA